MRRPVHAFLLLLPWSCAAAADSLGDARARLFELAADGKARTVISLPLPDGATSAFTLWDSRTLPRDLLRRYPTMRSFRGSDTAGRSVRLDYAGGQARMSLREADGQWQPTAASPLPAFSPPPSAAPALLTLPQPATMDTLAPSAAGNVRYEFRLALAAGSAFTAANGGTREAALGAAAHLVNRANEVLENDLGVHLTLAAHDDRLMVADHRRDPLREGEPRSAAANLITRRLPASGYDLGHALLGLDGGETETGTSCSDAMDADYLATHKAAAWSGGADPDAAFANFLLVLGNQLGAPFRETRCWHCLAFDGVSIARVRNWLASRGGACARKYMINAIAPWIDPESLADPPVIPARTPFWLDATVEPGIAGRRLSYAWDDLDGQHGFRAAAPGPTARRVFTSGLPQGSRWLSFRLTVRDNGGETATVATDDARVQVVDTGRAFAMEPVPDGSAGQPLGIRWDPAGTSLAPISCHFLEASLSLDDGSTWQAVARDVANTGSAAIPLPAGTATQHARLRLSCDWRPFFAESPAPFRIR
ncbi:reprolysin-like metallopeptidase [Luteibacter aegosomatissinici]|uniref:reprolysin-like metallopeptidase n=1 Tax=Luteibacter aegosomatissinici TaxID=2911539 RepID=UPI001FFB6C9A|nr:hypothetical protein [Luteibacter aegosomatissinici]UPG94948.1 hypothetical protein L2Y97_02235 [Luteibacter aegosomatissinici]